MIAGCPWKGLCQCHYCMFLAPNDALAKCVCCGKEALRGALMAWQHLIKAPNGREYVIAVVYCVDCGRERK